MIDDARRRDSAALKASVLDVVALLTDLPAQRLARRQVGGERTLNGKRRFVGYLKDHFSKSMIHDITVEKVVEYLKTLQNEGKLQTRDGVRAAGEDICKFADLKRTGYNPFRDLGDFLIANISERRPAITELMNAVEQLFQDIAAP